MNYGFLSAVNGNKFCCNYEETNNQHSVSHIIWLKTTTKVGEVDVIVSVYITWPITFYLNNIKQLTRCYYLTF